MDSVTAERFLNTYHNASPPPSPDVPEDLTSFMLAADRVLAEAAELARVLARAHQAAATQLIGEGWAHTRKYCSLPEKYAGWADDRAPAKGYGVHAFAHQVSRPIRLTDEELPRSSGVAELRGRGGAACRVDIGRDQPSQEEDGPMTQVGSVVMLCTEGHRGRSSSPCKRSRSVRRIRCEG